MAKVISDFYQFESLWKIMKGEEKRGKLKTYYYLQDVKNILWRIGLFFSWWFLWISILLN